jgi:DNA modification methylase
VKTDEWVRDAHGVWTDIRETDVLDGWMGARDEEDEKHVCPLQLEVIRRCIRLYTNAGETVLDPFMGIGSTAWVALHEGRHVVGFELKETYHEQSLKNVAKARAKITGESMDLFGFQDSI